MTRRLAMGLVAVLLATATVQAVDYAGYRPEYPPVPGWDTRAGFGGTYTLYINNTLADNSDALVTRSTMGTACESILVCKEGSLRSIFAAHSAASTCGVVVFEVGGTIDLAESDISTTRGCLTIAGQTAPAPGILIKRGGLWFTTDPSHIVVQHIRIRPGDGGSVLESTADHNALLFYPSGHDLVMDHVSLSWSGGKNFQVFNSTGNILFWRSCTTENLYRAANVSDPDNWMTGQVSSFGWHFAVGQHSTFSIIDSISAHNSDRNPEMASDAYVYFLNNIVYDWGKDANHYPWATFLYSTVTSYDGKYNIAGNNYIAGPAGAFGHPDTPLYAVGVWLNPSGLEQLWMDDNSLDSTQFALSSLFLNTGVTDPRVGTAPLSLNGYPVRASSINEAFVASNACARPLDLDTVDARVIHEVITRTGDMIQSQTAVGGFPTLASTSRSFMTFLPADPLGASPLRGSPWTKMEDALNAMALDVETHLERGSRLRMRLH